MKGLGVVLNMHMLNYAAWDSWFRVDFPWMFTLVSGFDL